MNETEFIVTVEQTDIVSEVISAAETAVTTTEITTETTQTVGYDYNQHEFIVSDLHGIFLMTSGIFFLLVIYFIGKFFGNFFSM